VSGVKKLKVLIIDDEYFIREGLRTIIDWNKYGFEICGDTDNGKDGLEMVRQLMPDLIIVDIKMPVMDGLQMVEELRKQGFGCKVVILTAYPDFRFAQKSIELNIDSYLLKPIEQQALIEKITKVHNSIINTQEMKQYMDESISLSKDKIIEQIVIGNIPCVRLEKYNMVYGFDFPWRNYTVGLIDISTNLPEEINLRNNIMSEAENYISKYGYGYVFYTDKYIGVLLKNMVQDLLPRILKEIQHSIFDKLKISVTISLGESVGTIEDVKKSYIVACKLMDKKFLYGHNKIMMGFTRHGCTDKSCYSINDFNLAGVLDKLYNAVDLNYPVQINNILEEVKNYFLLSEADEDTIKINYTDMLISIVTRLSVKNKTLEYHVCEKKEMISQIYKKTSLLDLHGYIKYKLISLSDELSGLRPEDTIKKMTDYIERNYDLDIKLETLASIFNYNSNYLGKLFKCNTGQSFNTYLDHVRIENAKALLQRGFKVYQVVDKVGIRDIDYFYKKFKRYTGMSPSCFRSKG
jgi:two-component system response regulator YesN